MEFQENCDRSEKSAEKPKPRLPRPLELENGITRNLSLEIICPVSIICAPWRTTSACPWTIWRAGRTGGTCGNERGADREDGYDHLSGAL